jgi:predicted site-specific integrase-resolvase
VVVNLKEWAREQGVHPVTAYRWFREGKLPVPARRAGRLILVDPDPKPVPVSGMVAAYCRVSSAEQKDDLERQIGRVVAEATGRGLAVGKVVSEVGSGMNGHRRKLTELLSDPAVTVIACGAPRPAHEVRVRASGRVDVGVWAADCRAGCDRDQ